MKNALPFYILTPIVFWNMILNLKHDTWFGSIRFSKKTNPGSNLSKFSEARIVVVTPNKVVQKKVLPPSSQCWIKFIRHLELLASLHSLSLFINQVDIGVSSAQLCMKNYVSSDWIRNSRQLWIFIQSTLLSI